MRIAILTICGLNYGNRLQNYALQVALEREGHDVCTLQRELIPSGLMGALQRTKKRIGKTIHRRDWVGRFQSFDSRHIQFAEDTVCGEHTTQGLSDHYECFVIGSDQVWNPTFAFTGEDDYLPMVEPSKKIAYAASFGVNEIVTRRERTAELLRDIPFISVREDTGARIVEGLIGRKVPVVLDPTLLIGSEEWGRVSRVPSFAKERKPYLFKYVLGDDVNNAQIARIAKEKNLKILDAMDGSLAIGPSEFVWLISHCDLVCTDSYHASVFSVIHHKPLVVFERMGVDADMSSRFDTLFRMFDLPGCHLPGMASNASAVYEADWDVFDSRLEELRNLSLTWLQSALSRVERG